MSQGSLSFVCTSEQHLAWYSSLWEGEIKVNAGNDSKLPAALNVEGVTLIEKNSKDKNNCLSSTLTFAGTLSNLAQINNKVLSCSDSQSQQPTDTITISLPGWLDRMYLASI